MECKNPWQALPNLRLKLWNALKITNRSHSTAEKHSFAEMDAIIHIYISLKTRVFKRKAFCAYNMAYMMQLIDVIETQL